MSSESRSLATKGLQCDKEAHHAAKMEGHDVSKLVSRTLVLSFVKTGNNNVFALFHNEEWVLVTGLQFKGLDVWLPEANGGIFPSRFRTNISILIFAVFFRAVICI